MNRAIDEKELVSFLYENPNLPYREIAKHFFVHEGTIANYCSRLGVKRPGGRKPKISKEEFIEFVKNNPHMSKNQMANHLGLNIGSVIYRFRKLGLTDSLLDKEMTIMGEVQYDRWGRMQYHPEFHPNQGKRYTVKELAYLCKYYIPGNVKTLALDLGRTEHSVRQYVNELRRKGLFDHYKYMNV